MFDPYKNQTENLAASLLHVILATALSSHWEVARHPKSPRDLAKMKANEQLSHQIECHDYATPNLSLVWSSGIFVGCRKATNHLCCLIFWYNITEKNCHIPTDSKASYATEGLTILITGPVELRTNTPATITPNPVVLRANDHEFANRIQ